MSIAPGLHDGLDEATYHGHRESLSVSGAKRLLPPSCPAKFRWEQDNGGRPNKDAFDFGHAAHAKVLGVGMELAVVDAPDWRTKAAQEAKRAAYADGKVPLLAHDKVIVDEMAATIRQHPIAAALLDPDHGKPEQSGFWQDTEHDVLRRFRLDWLPDTDGGRLIVPDYKTARSAEPRAIAKAVADYGYAMQDAWYRDGCTALGLAEDIAFVFVFQETAAPYLVTVVELDADAVHFGRSRNDQALQVFRECTATDTWPSYSEDVALISLPKWATYNYGDAAA